ICSCGQGAGLESFASLKTLRSWKLLRPAALGPICAVSHVETVGDVNLDEGKCRSCGGSGKPTLLICGRCKRVECCSATCQRADWKAHKKACQN
ncbi:hypothetical protein NEOLEDRAFT_1079426, partial [Neolentinus lepideus HHB14362 ss-1]